MNRFLRYFRLNLLLQNTSLFSNGRFKKYLGYAIGEIILVVIGILIAFQLNEWGKQRERNALEHKILTEMYLNLQMDSIDMTTNIRRNTSVLNSSKAIRNQLEKRVEWNDSMGVHYALIDRFISKVALTMASYDNLKSSGFDLIRNDSLRSKIHEVYAQNYPFVVRMEQEHAESMKYALLLPQLTAKITTISDNNSKPIHLEALWDDNAFKETIIRFIDNLESFNHFYERLLNLEIELMQMIKKEINWIE